METATGSYEIAGQTSETAAEHPATRAAMAVNSIAASSRTLELITAANSASTASTTEL